MNTYLIFDINQSLLEPHPIEQGKSNADAIRRYASKTYPKRKIKASGDNDVQLAVQECVIENRKPLIKSWKRKTWYKFI